MFGQAKKPIDICTKIVQMDTKIFNIIPGSGEVTILLYGDIGDGGKVEPAVSSASCLLFRELIAE